MAFGFSNISHAIASVAKEFVVAEKAVAALLIKAVPVLQKLAGTEAVVEQLTAVSAGPSVVEIERAAYAALGIITKAAQDANIAIGAGTVNVTLETAVINDFKALYAFFAPKAGVPVAPTV